MRAHPTANIHPDAKIGKNVVIEPFATIYADVVIGEGTWVGPNAVIFNGARIGDNCIFYHGAVIGSVGDDDLDGILNDVDQCNDTPPGEPVYQSGCSDSELDDDMDNVSNDQDSVGRTDKRGAEERPHLDDGSFSRHARHAVPRVSRQSYAADRRWKRHNTQFHQRRRARLEPKPGRVRETRRGSFAH